MNDGAKPLLSSDAMYRELLKVGELWADSKAAYQALEDATKSVLADVTQSYAGGNGKTSYAQMESMARRSPIYRDHLSSVALAHKTYLRAQVRYDSLRTLVELRRSEESTRRAEMQL